MAPANSDDAARILRRMQPRRQRRGGGVSTGQVAGLPLWEERKIISARMSVCSGKECHHTSDSAPHTLHGPHTATRGSDTCCANVSRPLLQILLRKQMLLHRSSTCFAQSWQPPTVVADREVRWLGAPYITLTWWMRMYTSGRSRFGARSTVFSLPAGHARTSTRHAQHAGLGDGVRGEAEENLGV